MSDSKIFIKNEVKKDALKALKIFGNECIKNNKDLRWVNIKYDILEPETLEEALENLRYECENDEFGNIIDLDFCGEKLGDDLEIFNSIAKFFNEGSYIEMYGEDGCSWRWIFKDGQCNEVYPKINWD